MLFHFGARQTKPARPCKLIKHRIIKSVLPNNKNRSVDLEKLRVIIIPCGTGGGRLGGLAPPLKFPPNSSG